MKRLLFFAAFMLLSASAAFASCSGLPNCRQCTGQGSISAGTSGTLSFGVLPLAGSTIKLFLAPYFLTDITAHGSVVTDNQSGNSYAVNSGASIVSTATNNRLDIFAGIVVGTTGTFTLTWGLGGSSFSGVWMACEIIGLDSSSYDRHGTQETLSNTSITVTATTSNSQAGEFVCALMYNNGGGAGASIPSGYIELFLDNVLIGAEAACKAVSASETSAATWNYSSGDSLAVLTTDKLIPVVQRRTADSPRTGTRNSQ